MLRMLSVFLISFVSAYGYADDPVYTENVKVQKIEKSSADSSSHWRIAEKWADFNLGRVCYVVNAGGSGGGTRMVCLKTEANLLGPSLRTAVSVFQINSAVNGSSHWKVAEKWVDHGLRIACYVANAGGSEGGTDISCDKY